MLNFSERNRSWRQLQVLAVMVLTAVFGVACSTFSPSTSFEPEYYIDEYGMVHVPQRSQGASGYELRPAYGRFDSGLRGGVYTRFGDPFFRSVYGYDPFGRSIYHPGTFPGFGYYRGPAFGHAPGYVSRPPQPPTGDQTPTGTDFPRGGIQHVPVSSPVNILRNAPEPVVRGGGAIGSDQRSQRRIQPRTPPSYRDGPRATRPAQPSQRPRPARKATRRPTPPPSRPRVIDP